MKYFIADLHDKDENVLLYEHRPFATVEEQHYKFIENWNNKVKKDDEVYLVGDIGDIEILRHLNGKITIVLGNHDDMEKINKMYPNIKTYDVPIMIDGLWLSHEPIGYIPPECPYLNIHGHLHRFIYGLPERTWNAGNRYFCVSVEQIGYTPISLEEISKIIKYKECTN